MATPPEVEQILNQVLTELLKMYESGETGTVTVHCAPDQMLVEANPKRKGQPVKIERGRPNFIRPAR